ncbi:hypothetical protein PAHAL_9G143400 [Panicum hallii]|uniref:KIB1-4 beta-propeller domain-containing protein n=1 Tax=Panicum hallii TaxID=206008 RepID=A0A2T8I176_9POAL|nr:hypothetical protein PAHAL_9G143400 [Panicum hallii]
MAGPLTSPATVASDASTSPWPSLPDDLIRLLASRFLAGDLLDYLHFRAVCAPWRSSTASPRGRGVVEPRFHPRHWALLPEGHGLYPGHPKLHGYVRFFNLDTGAFVRVHIPLFDDHCVLDSYQGPLVLQRDHDTAIRLLHPFTGDILDLPPLSTLLPQMRQELQEVRPARLKLPWLRSVSTAATFADGVVTVLLAFCDLHRVAVATSQDHQWTMSTWHYAISSPPFPHQGKFYVVYVMRADHQAKIFRIDTPLPGEVLQPPKLIATTIADKLRGPIYFVECDSEVLVIGYGGFPFSKMPVYKLADLVMERYIPVTSIGDKAIFLQNRTLSVSAKALPTVVGDTIICFQPMEHYVAQYHLSRSSWSPAMDKCSLRGTEPGPCSLIQHIYTCCSWRHRNKGLLLRGYRGGWLRWPVNGKLRQGVSLLHTVY